MKWIAAALALVLMSGAPLAEGTLDPYNLTPPDLPPKSAIAKEGTVVLQPLVGCQTEDNYRWMVQMATDGSTDAIAGFIEGAYRTGECVPLKVGTRLIILDEEAVMPDMSVAVKKPPPGGVVLVQVKRPGKDTTYWTIKRALRVN
jgi:hypothetical protein